MRVVTGTICHETSTFTPVATTWESYRDEHFGYLRAEEILEKFHGTNSPIGGFIDGAEKHGFELIPTIYANAHPSGPTPRHIFDTILGDLLDGICSGRGDRRGTPRTARRNGGRRDSTMVKGKS